jgi:acyl-coenzyme A synthetase/AMP-(fatty) acid ligase
MGEKSMTEQHPYEWLRHHSFQQGDAIALEDTKNSFSFKQLKHNTDHAIAKLRQLGVKSGEAVAYVVPKDHREVVLFLAILASSAIAVPLNRLWKPHQMAKAISAMGARWLIAEEWSLRALRTDPLLVTNYPQYINLTELITPCDTLQPLTLADLPAFSAPKLDAPSLIMFTSGSTGDPKGVAHSCQALASWTDSTARYLRNTSEDRIFGFLPLGFGYGLNQFLTALKVGARFRISNAVLTLDVLKEAAQWGATGLAGIPQFWGEVSDLMQRSVIQGADLDLRYVTNAGGHLSRDAQFRLKSFFPETDIISMYGMTETLRSSYVPAALFETKAGSLGIPVPGAELLLLNEEQQICAPGQPGELVHLGPTIALSYWRAPDQSAERFRLLPALEGQRPSTTRACYTGDVAWQDDDQIFWYQARKDRQVKVRGFRFGPHEVEDEVKKLAGIDDAALIALKDPAQGSTVLHLVIETASESNEQLLEQIQQHLHVSLPSYMKSDGVHFFPGRFPRTANGKLDHLSMVNFLKDQRELIAR